jgi:hypothetical protein
MLRVYVESVAGERGVRMGDDGVEDTGGGGGGGSSSEEMQAMPGRLGGGALTVFLIAGVSGVLVLEELLRLAL